MIKERYLTGVVTTWDNTAARQAIMGLEPPRDCPLCMGRNGQRLLRKKPTVSTRGMSYNDANKTYTDAHTTGTLSDADYAEWIVSVRGSMQTTVNIFRCPKYILNRCGITSSTMLMASSMRQSTTMRAVRSTRSLTVHHA